MNLYRKFKKSTKALSPVVASIILIAVTVAVSVVVAAWMGGMTIGLMGSAEQVAITNIQFDDTATPDTITVTVQNTGDTSVTISSAFLDNAPVTITAVEVAKATTEEVDMTLSGDVLAAGTQYTVKLVTQEGNSLVYSAVFNG